MPARPTKIAGRKPKTGMMEVLWTDGVWRKSGEKPSGRMACGESRVKSRRRGRRSDYPPLLRRPAPNEDQAKRMLKDGMIEKVRDEHSRDCGGGTDDR